MSYVHCPSCLRFKFSRQFTYINYILLWVVTTCVYGNVSSRFGNLLSCRNVCQKFDSVHILHHISQNMRLQCRSQTQKIFDWNVGRYCQHWTALRLTGVTVYPGFVGSVVTLVVEQRTLTALAFWVGTWKQAGRKVTKSVTCTDSYSLTFTVLELRDRIRVDKPNALYRVHQSDRAVSAA